MKNTLLIFLLLIPIVLFGQQHIYLADPTIVYFDGHYYMYGTEKKPQQGIPVLQSDDLKKWIIPPNVSDGRALKGGRSAYGTWGFWAPQVFRYNNKYYMIYTAEENIALAESDSPTGPFTQKEAVPLKADTRQIDPYLFFDDNGKIYLYHVRLNKGNTIWVAEFKEDMSGIKEETLTQCITATERWEDTQTFESAPIIEGPTVIKRKDIYYLFYSANHFQSTDYAVGYATSHSPFGPWKKAANNPIINKCNIGENGTGHGDLFRDAAGQWQYVFHVHCNDSVVNPRRVQCVGLKFSTDRPAEPEVVTIDKSTLYVPQMQ